MQINPSCLKTLRKKARISQQMLAEESGVTKRTIARIESGGGGETRGPTVNLLAEALRVKPEVLSQEPESEAVREADLRELGLRQVKLILDNKTILAYDLVGAYYGVDMKFMLNVGPLLFALLAEQCCADRRRRAEEAKAALEACEPALVEFYTNIDEHLEAHVSDYDDSTSFDIGMTEFFSSLSESCERRGLFGYRWNGMFEDYVERNPFSDFLKQLAEELDPDDKLDLWDRFNAGGFLQTAILMNFRKSLTGGSGRADYALSHGYVRIGQIPEELRGEDKDVTSERKKWLESKVPDGDWVEYEDRMRRHKEIINKVLNKEGAEYA